MAAFEAEVAELGKIVGALPVDNTPKGQFFQVAREIHQVGFAPRAACILMHLRNSKSS